ncbi:MAG: exonuclease SbcCD subunit D C-terminal domain-containing protein [Rhodoferax sp.]|nr:exonuclease SbcCD subunit D C-terminal domain-containing protein [Rhodoferax sp.]
MKLLHTSDWHLGQSLNQYERGFEHAQFLAWLLETLVAEQVDVLLIAGDVFDNTNPSSASQSQLYQFLTQARQRVPQLTIVMTAGNHDSPGRMEAPAPFLSLLDAHVVGQPGRGDTGVDLGRIVLPLKDRSGAVAAWCIAMPFLRPGDVPRVEGATDPYQAGIAALYAQAYAHALSLRSPGQAIIAMGHCHLTGGQVSLESERPIVIGGSESLPVQVFDAGIAYVALGHLHLAQSVGGDATRRYCGSPLPLSFSEMDYQHQVLLVELSGEQVAGIRPLPIPRSVDLLRVPRQPAPLTQVLAELQALQLPELPLEQQPYLQVRVRLSQPEPGLRAQVEAALAAKPVRLVRIETSSLRGDADAAPALSMDELSTLTPVDYFERLYRHRFDADAPADLMAAFTELVHAHADAGASA